MALIAFPRDILSTFPGWSTKFELAYRQERSRTAGGSTIAKDFGSPIWKAHFQTKVLRPNELDKWRAILAGFDGGIQSFLGYNLARSWPIAYPSGSWPTGVAFNGKTATIAFAYTDRKRIDISNLPPGFVLKTGDQIQIGTTDLHWVQNDVTADGSGLAGQVELRPHLWPAAAAGNLVSVRQPHCIMAIDPDSLSADGDPETGHGPISFDAWEVR